MKRFLVSGFAILVCISMIVCVQPAMARPPHHYHHHHHGPGWGGFAIGLGAGLLGGLLINEYAAPAPRYYYSAPAPSSGHWEIRNQWVPGSRNWVWQPGHYDTGGVWIQGQWMQMEQGGHWRQEQVWVPHY